MAATAARSTSSVKSEPLVGILLVDDNPANLLSLHAFLDDLGQNLIDARSGDEALDKARHEDFAVILLDVVMPGTNGFETAALLRRNERSQHTPIIFLSAYEASRPQLEEGYSLGAVDFLVKPIVPMVLRAKVQGFIELFQDRERTRREAEHLRLLVHGTTDYAIFMLDPDGNVATWNPGAERLKGYKADEIIGQHFSKFYPQEAIDRGWPEHELKVARNEGRFEDEGWRLRKDGSRFWANVVITALRDERGNMRGFSKVTRDITARKYAEEALRHSEERFRLLIETARDYAIFMLDPQGYVMTWNLGAERIKGYKAAEIIGQHFSKFYPKEAIDRGWPEHELKVAAADGRFEDEGWRVRKDGSQFWANVVLTALRDDAGNLAGFSKITRDMSERKRAEESARRLLEETIARRVAEENYQLIQEQRERLRVTLASIGDAVISTDAEGRINFLNPVAQQLVGWDNDAAAGRELSAVFRIIREDTREPIENPALCVLREGSIVGLTNHTLLISKDGVERPIADSAAVIRDAEGTILGSVLVFRDISETRRVERTLRENDRRKDEFLATLAHELRNPLAPIRNSLQILKMARVDATTAQQTREMMERQVHHLVRLVDDLLDVSRVMRGQIELRREPVELAAVIARAVETAMPLVEANAHELDISVTDESLLLDIDPVRIAQVIGNLLTNAAKYTEPHGKIWLTVEKDSEKNRDSAMLTVRDTGIGIAPDMLPHIFELFVQADAKSTRTQGGLGIGLTLVKNLVELHRGTVEAKSAGLGRGSEFVVRLPLAKPKTASPASSGPAEHHRVTAPSGFRILVVDDNRDAANSLGFLLRLQGHEVRLAYDGPSSLELAKEFRPHMVFLDLGMPLMDGYEVARRIRATPELNGTVLAALTGWGQKEDRQRTAAAGFNHHLVKPPEPKALEALVAELKQSKA